MEMGPLTVQEAVKRKNLVLDIWWECKCNQTDGEVRLKPCKRLAGSGLELCQTAQGAERETLAVR